MTTAPTGIAKATWWLLASLYTTQSVALMFFMGAFVAILLEQGASMERVSLVYAVGMVWPFKLLWAPFIDRFRLGWLGHYRGWLILMQSGLVITLVALAGLDVVRDFEAIYAGCLLIALLSATQDIAVDGLACRVLPPARRGLGNGLQIAGGLMGNLVGAGAVLVAYRYVGWHGSMMILAAVTAVSLVQLVFYREPRWPAVQARTRDFVLRLWTFWRQPGWPRWLLLVLFYTVSSSLAYALVIPLLMARGWSLDRVGWVVNVFGSVLGCAAAMGSGWALYRLGRRRALVWAAVLQVLGVLAIALLLREELSDGIAMAAVGVYFLGYNPAAVVLATLMMDHVSRDSPATDYTVQYSLNQFFALGMITAGAALAVPMGYGGVLALAAAVAVLAAGLAGIYREPLHMAAGGDA
ncbi:MAG: MFS transporter [Stenotrophomonas sp.]